MNRVTVAGIGGDANPRDARLMTQMGKQGMPTSVLFNSLPGQPRTNQVSNNDPRPIPQRAQCQLQFQPATHQHYLPDLLPGKRPISPFVGYANVGA